MTIENLGVKLYSGTKADRVSDSLGSDADGSNTGITKIGKIGAGQASFDGNDKASVTGQTIALSNDGWAVSGWFYSTTAGSLQMITYLPTSGSDIYLYKNTDNTIKTEGLGGTISSSAISTNQWYHFVINYDHSSTTTTLYLDGTSAGTATGAQAVNITSIEIGAEGSSYYWNGKMDDVAVFSRKLTSAEITSLSGGDATSTISATNLQALYTFDSNFNDSSTNSRNLTNSGVTLETAKLGTGAYSFNGSTDKITTTVQIPQTTDHTVTWWQKVNSTLQTDTTYQFVMRATGSGGNYYAIFFRDNYLKCMKGEGSQTQLSAQSNFAVGDWHHCALVRNDTTDDVTFYLDGVATTVTDGMTEVDTSANLWIGSNNGSEGAPVTLDDVSIWARALTATEIGTLSGVVSGTPRTSYNNLQSDSRNIAGTQFLTGHKLIGTSVTEVKMRFKNLHSLSGGTITCKILNSDKSVKTTFSSISTGDIDSSTYEEFTFTGSATTIAVDDIICAEITNSASNDIEMGYSGAETNAQVVEKSSGSWTSSTSNSITYKVVESDGALVSSLTDKSNLKAYYSMDSTSMGAVANYTTNFSSNTGWTESSGNVTIDTSDEEMDFHIESGTSGAKGYYDLTTVSDTNWVLRFENWNLSTLNTYGGMWMGISSQTSADGANSGSSIFTRLADYGDGDDYLVVASFNSSTTRVDGSVGRPALSTGTNYNIELSRDGTTVTTKLFTDNFKTPIATSTDTISGTTGLRYLFVGSEYQPASGNTNTNMIGTMQGIKFYNGVSAVDGCKNDFSSTSDLDALTGVRTNSIFQQTDDTPTYWWYNGTSWLLDGTTDLYSSDFANNSTGWSTSNSRGGFDSTGAWAYNETSTPSNSAKVNYDLGVNVGTKFILRWRMKLDSGTQPNNYGYFWIATEDSLTPSNYTGFVWKGPDSKVAAGKNIGDPSTTFSISSNTWYYFEITRSSIGSGGGVLKSYSDSTYSGTGTTIMTFDTTGGGSERYLQLKATHNGNNSTKHYVDAIQLQNGTSEWLE